MNRWKKAKLLTGVVHAFQRSRAYLSEGDDTMNSADNLRRRAALREDPQLRQLLLKFWSVIDLLKDPVTGHLLKSGFISLNIKLQRALLHDFDEEEAARHARLDFATDVGEHRTDCTKEEFLDGLFQLVDLWCETTDVAEYLHFLTKSLEAIVREDISAEQLSFKKDEDIAPGSGFGDFSGSSESGVSTGVAAERRRSLIGGSGRRVSIFGNEVDGATEAGDTIAAASMAAEAALCSSGVPGVPRATLPAEQAGARDAALALALATCGDVNGAAVARDAGEPDAAGPGATAAAAAAATATHERELDGDEATAAAPRKRADSDAHSVKRPARSSPLGTTRSFNLLQVSDCDRLNVRTRGRARQLLSVPSMNLQEQQAAPLRRAMRRRLGVDEATEASAFGFLRPVQHDLEPAFGAAQRVSPLPWVDPQGRAEPRRKQQRATLLTKLSNPRKATTRANPAPSIAELRRGRAADLSVLAQRAAECRAGWRLPLLLPQIRA